MSLRHAIVLAVCVFGTLAAAPGIRAADTGAETWVVAGRTYERVRVLEVTAANVMIAHAGGMVQLDLGALAPELQQRFHYDADKAAASRRVAEAGMAASDAVRQREEAERRRKAELAAVRERIAQRELESDPHHVEFKAEVDLRPIFIEHSLNLKNQGARPSCSVFVVVSALEYEYARRFGQSDQLSEEYLIWAFQRTHPKTSINDGYNVPQLLEVLRTCGIARRSMLPDSFASYRKDENPPTAALDDAVTRRSFHVVPFEPEDKLLLTRIVHALNAQVPVILGIRWPPHATLEHNNLLKDQTPQPGPAHAVLLVGYRSEGAPESLVFIFRNSYGPQWGLGGYGLMAGSYLRKNTVTAFCLQVPKAE